MNIVKERPPGFLKNIGFGEWETSRAVQMESILLTSSAIQKLKRFVLNPVLKDIFSSTECKPIIKPFLAYVGNPTAGKAKNQRNCVKL